MTVEKTAVLAVAELMVLAARTAPKAKGEDTILTRVILGKDLKKIADRMLSYGEKHNLGSFLRDAKNLSVSDACVIIGARGDTIVGVNCGACGFPSCAEMAKERKKRTKRTTAFAGPNCAIRMADLGIAVGSAAKTAQIHNADNRVMYSAGVAAVDLALMGKDCTVAYAIPLSATGKNIFFDR